ncbi:MAG TPA: TonB-dependent receptor [Nevskiaceae bacterium]|nr:TonB-dependent receptor [Nevskiaceae bacterium]
MKRHHAGLLLGVLTGFGAQAQDVPSSESIPVEPPAQAADVAAEAPTEEASGARQVETVVVTAQKVAQSLEDVPVSVTAIGGDFIRESGTADLAQVAAYVPNVRVDADDLGSPQLFIRGFGTNSFNPSFEGSVGFVQDDVYFGRPGYFTESMFDIERVEVLRGPQGTLFGKNTIAGVFNVASKGPTDEWGSDVQVSYGENDTRRAEAGVGGPITDWLGIRVAGLYRDSDGELYNTFLDRDEEKMEQSAGRMRLVLTPLDGLRSELMAAASTTEAAFWPFQLYRLDSDTENYLQAFDDEVEDDPKDFRTSMNTPGHIQKGSTTFALNTSYTAEDVAGLKSVTPVLVLAWSKFHIDQFNELDDSPSDIANLDSHEDHNQRSAEFRVSGAAESLFGLGTGVEFVGGAFYFDSHYDLFARAIAGGDLASYALTEDFLQLATGNADITIPDVGGIGGIPVIGDLGSLVVGEDYYRFDYQQDVRSTALFGQMTWYLDEHWAVTPGLRINKEKKKADTAGRSVCPLKDQGIPRPCVMEQLLGSSDYDERNLKRDEDDVSPKIVLQYFLESGGNIYASYTRGFKSGGYNSISLTGQDLAFKPEKAKTGELGIKGRGLDGSLRYSLTLYYTKFSNLQVLAFNGVFFDVSNAASATSQGIESDFEWLAPWEPLSVTGSWGLLDAQYDDYDGAPAPISEGIGAEQDLGGRRIAFAPKMTATLTPTITLPFDALQWRFAVDVLYQGEQYTDTDLDPATKVDAYTQLGARISLSDLDERWTFTLGGQNLTDKRVLNQVTDATFFPGTYFAQEARGRQIFGAVSLRF